MPCKSQPRPRSSRCGEARRCRWISLGILRHGDVSDLSCSGSTPTRDRPTSAEGPRRRITLRPRTGSLSLQFISVSKSGAQRALQPLVPRFAGEGRPPMQVLSRPPSGWPALVLNADFRPLSYYPLLSYWPWRDVIKAVFLDRVDVVSTYDQVGPLALLRDEAAERGLLEAVRDPGPAAGLHALQPLPARRLHLPVLPRGRGPDLRPCDPALARRAHDLGEHRRQPASRLQRLQPRSGRPTPREARVHPLRTPHRPSRPSSCSSTGRRFPPHHLHESWLDYLCWDIELEA